MKHDKYRHDDYINSLRERAGYNQMPRTTDKALSWRYALLATIEKLMYATLVVIERGVKYFLVGCELSVKYTLMAIEVVLRALIYVVIALAILAGVVGLVWLVVQVFT